MKRIIIIALVALASTPCLAQHNNTNKEKDAVMEEALRLRQAYIQSVENPAKAIVKETGSKDMYLKPRVTEGQSPAAQPAQRTKNDLDKRLETITQSGTNTSR